PPRGGQLGRALHRRDAAGDPPRAHDHRRAARARPPALRVNRREFVAAVARGVARRSDVQFAPLGRVRTVDGVGVRSPPVYTLFVTVQLKRIPRHVDFGDLIVGYGMPYFTRIDGFREHIPRARSGLAFADAVAGPTDPPDVRLEDNDMLLIARGNS